MSRKKSKIDPNYKSSIPIPPLVPKKEELRSDFRTYVMDTSDIIDKIAAKMEEQDKQGFEYVESFKMSGNKTAIVFGRK